ncbi:hypothetical protein C4J81_10710 [Deltaproteobacteria bacterium Smac51]|nr:hypothetical protein C4J81_10710 [Deltaproteobacteria bacterium Smac51]
MTAFSRKYYRSLEPLLKAVDHKSPVDWEKVFDRAAPLEFEIGFGNGEYLHRISLDEPERNFVGVEVAWASIKRALRRLASPPRRNVRVMLLKAEVALERCFAPQSLDVVRSLFPIPWPDERQEKKRLFKRDFLNLSANRLKADGRFILVTDSLELAEWTLSQSEQSAIAFTMEECQAVMDTKYERKWHGGGQRIFYHLTGTKKFHPELPLIKDIEMQAYYRDDFNPETYQPQDSAGDIVVKFREFIFDPKRQEGMLRTFVVEGTLTQEFFIKIFQHGQRWKFTPAIGSQLYPTQGIARALELASGGRPATAF